MGENNTIQSISLAFIRTIQDVSQYVSHQRALGNTALKISAPCRATMDAWGKPKKNPAFFFQGPTDAPLFFVDSEGSFFNGEAGALFVKILGAMKLGPESIFVCNAIDARSIHDRIKINQPAIVITLGQKAGQLLLNLESPIEHFQGKFFSHEGIRVMPTFHPSTLLEQPGLKRKVWEDMQQVMKQAGLSHGR
ncbi:MAG: uracil-DNA glycosylase [Proteobacteria bacterium]|nr:uracil-DNA glycosylase [Pseudomonadota bacterium]